MGVQDTPPRARPTDGVGIVDGAGVLRASAAHIGQGCVYALPVKVFEGFIEIGGHIAGQLGHIASLLVGCGAAV